MAMRVAARYVARRYSTGGSGPSNKVLNEEEKALENMYIRKTEKEKLDKLAGKGPKVEGGLGGGKVSSGGSSSSSSEKVSNDGSQKYAVVGGALVVLCALGWFLKPSSNNKEQARH